MTIERFNIQSLKKEPTLKKVPKGQNTEREGLPYTLQYEGLLDLTILRQKCTDNDIIALDKFLKDVKLAFCRVTIEPALKYTYVAVYFGDRNDVYVEEYNEILDCYHLTLEFDFVCSLFKNYQSLLGNA